MNNIIDLKDRLMLMQFDRIEKPEFVLQKRHDWIYYGKNNDYPKYLVDLYNQNAYHGAIINAKARYVFGGGFVVKSDVNSATAAEIRGKLEAVKANDTLRSVALDYELFDGFTIEVLGGKGNIKNVSFNHIDFSKIRSNEDGSEFAYTSFWLKGKTPNNKFEESEDFEVLPKYIDDKVLPKSLYYYKTNRAGMCALDDVYPLPNYMQGITCIETDIEITNFHYNNVKNGFSAGKMIVFKNGIPTTEEKGALERQFKGKFNGSENGGEIVMAWINQGQEAPEILNLSSNDLDKQFKELAIDLQQKIFTTHQVTSPMLFGIREQGQLSGRNEMLDAWELFNKTYIQPRQKVLLEVFERLFLSIGIPKGMIEISTLKPLDIQIDSSTIIANMTRAEIREKAGLPKEETPTPTPQPTQMTKQISPNDVLNAFKKVGKSKKEYDIILTKDMHFSSINDLLIDEIRTLQEFEDAETQDVLESTIKDVSKTNVAKIMRKAKIQVMYSYEWRPEVPRNQRNTAAHPSREFCQQVMDLDRFFASYEINEISREFGYDVFERAGGFWNRGGTIDPQCRHYWKKNIVRKKI